MPDYSRGKIYTIRCYNDNKLIYVGSTIQPLSKRWGEHKVMSLKKPDRLIYKSINNEWNKWYIELYELYPCDCKEMLCKREGEIIRDIGTLNKQIAGRTYKEYYIDNAEKIKEKRNTYYIDNVEKRKQYNSNNADKIKQYYIDNADKIKEQRKEYYQNNKDKIKEYDKLKYIKNAEKIKEQKKEYYQNNK